MKFDKRILFVFASLILFAFFNNCGGRFSTMDSIAPGYQQSSVNSSTDNSQQSDTQQPAPQIPQPNIEPSPVGQCPAFLLTGLLTQVFKG